MKRKRVLSPAETPVDILLRAVAASRRAQGLPWPPVRRDGHSRTGVGGGAPEEAG